jgi:DNA-binding transcriptional LysR family regulator
MDYNLRDLKFFETVAEFGHIGRAAEALGRSQPAITKCIRRLEAAVGSALLVRDGRGIHLTPTGVLLVERARELLRHAGQVGRELQDFSAGSSGHVRIGGGLSAADHVIPDVCASILAASSGVSFDVLLGPNISMREELREGRIDLLLGLLPADPDFVTVPIVQDVVVPAARLAHPAFAGAPVDLDAVLRHPWALPTREIPSRQWWDHALSALGRAPPEVRIQVNSPALLPRIAERSDLIAFMSRQLLRDSLRELPVPALTLARDFGVTYRRAGYLSPAARRTLDLLVSSGGTLFGPARQHLQAS